MSVVDIERLLAQVSAEAPCGEDLEYDPKFGEMTRAAAGRPEQQIGESVLPAVEPDWAEVRRIATELLTRTKDLRVGVHLARALVFTRGFEGLADGLAVVRGMLDRYWETLHPRLDPEDGNDPTFRINTVATLADHEQLVRGLRLWSLANSRRAGRFNLRDIEVARGILPGPGGSDTPPPEMAVIEAAFLDTEVAEIAGLAQAVTGSQEQLAGIEALLADRVGPAQTPDLGPLRSVLKSVGQVLTEQLARRGVGEAAAEPQESTGGAMGMAASVGHGISSREDVVRMLDLACDYFSRHEPSSPVPLLLQRAKRLIAKDFLEIVRDMAPSGLTEVQSIGGVDTQS